MDGRMNAWIYDWMDGWMRMFNDWRDRGVE